MQNKANIREISCKDIPKTSLWNMSSQSLFWVDCSCPCFTIECLLCYQENWWDSFSWVLSLSLGMSLKLLTHPLCKFKLFLFRYCFVIVPSFCRLFAVLLPSFCRLFAVIECREAASLFCCGSREGVFPRASHFAWPTKVGSCAGEGDYFPAETALLKISVSCFAMTSDENLARQSAAMAARS